MAVQLPELWVGQFSLAVAGVVAPENSVAEEVQFGGVGGLGRQRGKLGVAQEDGVGRAGVGVAIVVVPAIVPVVVKLELPGMVAGEVGREEAIQAAAENKGWFRDGGS